jgi:uncharacterized lipoprotein YddW (UPF0748 family)|tara:strand:- start:5350 stop:6513 length:1164 start_codon:yes stop_codon:yes gene_type:complete
LNSNRYRYFCLRAAFSVALLFSLNLASEIQNVEFEGRYLWVVRNTLTSKKNIDRMLQFATLNRFNNILVQVRGRGDAYYKSNIVPKSHLVKDVNFDPLSYLIPKAKEKGINVHAWINTYLLWSSNKKPIQLNHILHTNSDWIDQNNREVLNVDIEIQKKMMSNKGYEGLYLSPNHPKVNSYLLTIIRELIENYELDGIHFDYIRYHDSGYGKNPTAIAYYRKYHGFNALSSSVPSKSEISEWNDYKRKSITDLVRETRKLVDYLSPNIELSAAVKPNLYEARDRFFQEWDVWIAAGYLDKAIVMNYAPNLKEFARNIDIIYDNLPSKYWKSIVMGIATYNQSPSKVINKIKYSKVTRFKSVSFFSYNVMDQNPRYFRSIKKILFPQG